MKLRLVLGDQLSKKISSLRAVKRDVPALDLALGLRMERRPAHMTHALAFDILSQFVGDVASWRRTIILPSDLCGVQLSAGKNYLFMDSERGGQSTAIVYTLIETAKLNAFDPQA